MENASKALLIAAGVFFAILILSALIGFYNQFSSYYTQKHQATVTEQAKQFNAKFENYHRNNIRGSELISLMNRVIDYNTTESYFDETNYERIIVTITLVKSGENENDILNQFKYETDGTASSRNQFLSKEVTNTTGTGIKWKDDKKLISITNTPVELSDDLSSYGINNITEAQLQQLSAGIANIIIENEEDTTSSMAAYNRFKRAELLEDILGIKVYTTADRNIPADCKIKIDKDTGKTLVGQNIINTIKNVVSQYYQYTQFKRAYFDCTEVIYDTETTRVVEMNFELQTQDGNVVFN